MKSPLQVLLHSNKKKGKKFSPGCKLETVITQTLYTNAFELYIFDKKENMYKGVKKWLNLNNYTNFSDKEADKMNMVGVVFDNHRQPIKVIDDEEYRLFGAMFLAETHLTMDILAHECTHAAMTLERNIIRYMGMYDGNDGSGQSPEERLAYTIGSFVENILVECIKNKVKVKFIEDDLIEDKKDGK